HERRARDVVDELEQPVDLGPVRRDVLGQPPVQHLVRPPLPTRLVPFQFTSPYFVLGRRRSSRTTSYAPVASSLGPRLARNLARHWRPICVVGSVAPPCDVQPLSRLRARERIVTTGGRWGVSAGAALAPPD